VVRTNEITPGPVPLDPATAAQFGLPAGTAPPAAGLTVDVPRHGELSAGEQFYNRRALGGLSPGGSRWFEGANETLDDPSYAIRVGHLTGVDTIYALISHTDLVPGNGAPNTDPVSVCQQMFAYGTTTFGRQADIEVVWGAGGTLASVRDLTHNVAVPLGGTPGSNYGFVVDGNGNGMIDWADMAAVEELSQINTHLAFCGPGDGLVIPAPGAGTNLTGTATVTPVSLTVGAIAPGDFAAGGSGFGLYLAGHTHIFALTGGVLPAEGTRWVLRSVSGPITAETGAESTNPEGYAFTQRVGNPAIAGLQFRFVTSNPTTVRAATGGDLNKVHTVPDPYYVTNAFEQTTDSKIIKFVNLPAQAIIRIYSSSGVLVDLIEHNSSTFGGSADWDVRSRNNQVVASGVYFYHIESGGARRVGRFTVVNFAQ
ncbi:MAG TPA: T9SS type A sorting domain-containing protein, partial [Gemmatimonadales bacterium]